MNSNKWKQFHSLKNSLQFKLCSRSLTQNVFSSSTQFWIYNNLMLETTETKCKENRLNRRAIERPEFSELNHCRFHQVLFIFFHALFSFIHSLVAYWKQYVRKRLNLTREKKKPHTKNIIIPLNSSDDFQREKFFVSHRPYAHTQANAYVWPI